MAEPDWVAVPPPVEAVLFALGKKSAGNVVNSTRYVGPTQAPVEEVSVIEYAPVAAVVAVPQLVLFKP